MAISSVPRLYVTGAGVGVGKSLLVTGLLLALRRRGVSVSCVVVGRALQQAVIYHRITRRYTRCLDPGVLNQREIAAVVGQASRGADLILIDGAEGIGTDHGATPQHAERELARLMGAPIVLALDYSNMEKQVAEISRSVRGNASFGGCVVNRIRGDKALPEAMDSTKRELSDVISTLGQVPCLGALPELKVKGELPPYGVIQEKGFVAVPLQFLSEIEHVVSSNVDLDGILSLAACAKPLEYEDAMPVVRHGGCRIAVADDSSFGLCYQDNLDILRLVGADIVSFSPLADAALPRSIGGIYIPGAYLSECADLVSANTRLFRSILEFSAAGGVVYSEGSGTALLCRSYKLMNAPKVFPGVGLIPADAMQVRERPQVVRASIVEESVLGSVGAAISGFSSGEWQIRGRSVGMADPIINTLRCESAHGGSYLEGYSASAQSCSTLHFLHFASNPQLARFLVLAAATHQKTSRPPAAKE